MRIAILMGCWAIFVIWMTYGIIAEAMRTAGPPWMARQSTIVMALDLWSFAAALICGFIFLNPLGWLNGKRLILGGFALAMMLGRLISGNVAYLGNALPPGAYISDVLIYAAAPFLLLVSGTAVILLISFIIGVLFGFFIGIPVMIFNQIFQFEQGLHIFRHQANGLAGYISRAVLWLRNEVSRPSPPDETKGARFATREEMIAAHNRANEKPYRMGFGHWEQEKICLNLHTDKHVLIMASTRSGKGVTLIIPHLLRYPGSAFVLDPKGENAKATGRRRAQLNNRVHYLDPFGISGKPQSRFNPLSRFTPDNMEAESKALAAALFVVGDRERDHWTAAGQQLLAAVILYVYLSTDVPAANKDLPTVRKVLLGAMKPTLEAMTQMDDADGLLRDLAISFLETPEKEFGSVVSTTQRQTEILDNPYMVKCLAATGPGAEVDFKDWHRSTMTVYLCLSAPKFPTFNRWLRLVLTSALDEMTDTLNPPTLPVSFMLDELATLGHLTAVENAVGLAAGYGIQLVTVFQDVAQMKDLYKGRWASFIGNSGVRALFNLDDYETAEYWSRFIGGRLVETRSRQQDTYGLSKGDNVGEAMRPLLPPDKIMLDFASDQMLVLAQGTHPFVTKRVAYFDDQQLAGVWDDPRAPVKTAPKPSAPPPATPPAAPRPSSPPPAPSGGRPMPKAAPAATVNIFDRLQFSISSPPTTYDGKAAQPPAPTRRAPDQPFQAKPGSDKDDDRTR